MKGLVLSGGKGTRLRPITHTGAKQLVPIANKPILFYGLEALVEAGVSEIGIVVGDTAEEVKRAVGDGSRFGARVEYIAQPAPMGLAHAVATAREFLAGSDFVMYLGDNFITGGITGVVEQFQRERPDALILLKEMDHPERFGVAELEGERVVRLTEKPQAPRSNLVLVGVYLFQAGILEAVDAIVPSERGELEITDAIQWEIDHGRRVIPHVVTGNWVDTGKMDDLLECNRVVLDMLPERREGQVAGDSKLLGKVILEEGSEVIGSTIRGPVIIGAHTRVIDSFVGPFTALYHHVLLEGSEIEHSIVLENTAIKGVGKIEDSLIGRDVVIEKSGTRPQAHKLMLGDHSRVSLA
ncbi:MAG TPA: glucose-1-phosphate thymidylyltransferase [Candidatus Dormibacteraeota bacterium]|nr:glucose-1-phosphate thymidylyltransferase [Candidatus Dormibacteraeota bacterium]